MLKVPLRLLAKTILFGDVPTAGADVAVPLGTGVPLRATGSADHCALVEQAVTAATDNRTAATRVYRSRACRMPTPDFLEHGEFWAR
jgi:hypothetical protein